MAASNASEQTLSELDSMVRKEYEELKKQKGTPEDAAKVCIRRYVDTAVDTVLKRMTKDEKTEYWKGIKDAYINPSQTSWIKMALIRKLQRQVANMMRMNREPSKKAAKQDTEARPDSSTRDEGKIITLKHRNQLEEFHEHMQGLNKERKEMDNKLASLMPDENTQTCHRGGEKQCPYPDL